MLSFQWFPIKKHMFWLFSIFQLVFHLASIGFFLMFFFFFFCSQVLKLCTYLASQPAATRVSKRISLVQDLDEEQLRLGWWEIRLRWNGRPVFLQRTTVVSCFFFLNAEKPPKKGPWNGYLICFSIFRNRVFRQDQWWSSKKWRFGRFFVFLVGRRDGRTANHDHGDIWGLTACPNLDC